MRFVFALFALLLFSFPAPQAEAGAGDITFGGQLRVRADSYNNYNFNNMSDDKRAFIGQRTRFNVKATPTDDTTVFIQMQDARYWGDATGSGGQAKATLSNIRSGRENEAVDLYQAYVQINKFYNLPIDIKFGRQTLVYGSQRLLGHLGWHDHARAHDAFKAMWHVGGGQVDLFYTKQQEGENHGQTSGASGLLDADMWGAYSMWNVNDANKLDVYYLGWFMDSIDRDIRTWGARLAGKYGKLDYTFEGAWQNGDWTNNVTHAANAYSLDGGYSFGDAWASRLGLQFNAGSGDEDPSSGDHKTFVFPYHTNHAHYGFMDLFSWGNMRDLAIKLQTKPMGGKNTLKIDYHKFQLDKSEDAWLNVVGTGTQYAAVAGSTATDAGDEFDVTYVIPYNAKVKTVLGYSWFTPGDAAKDRNSGNNDAASWGYAMMVVGF